MGAFFLVASGPFQILSADAIAAMLALSTLAGAALLRRRKVPLGVGLSVGLGLGIPWGLLVGFIVGAFQCFMRPTCKPDPFEPWILGCTAFAGVLLSALGPVWRTRRQAAQDAGARGLRLCVPEILILGATLPIASHALLSTLLWRGGRWLMLDAQGLLAMGPGLAAAVWLVAAAGRGAGRPLRKVAPALALATAAVAWFAASQGLRFVWAGASWWLVEPVLPAVAVGAATWLGCFVAPQEPETPPPATAPPA